mgnify:CR=1 FL=1
MLLAFVLGMPTFAKPKKVKLGEVVVYEGEVNDKTPAGPGTLLIRDSFSKTTSKQQDAIQGTFDGQNVTNAVMTFSDGSKFMGEMEYEFKQISKYPSQEQVTYTLKKGTYTDNRGVATKVPTSQGAMCFIRNIAWADKVFSMVPGTPPAGANNTSTNASNSNTSTATEEKSPRKLRDFYVDFIANCKEMQDALPPAERSAVFKIGKFKNEIKDTIDCKTYGFLITVDCCMFYTIAGDYIIYYSNRRYCLSKTYKDGSRFHNVLVEQNYTPSAALSFDYNPDKNYYTPTDPRPDNNGYSWMTDSQGLWYGTDGPSADVYLGTNGERPWNLVKRLWTASETKPELKLNDNGTKRVLSYNQENRKVKSIIPKRIEEQVKPIEEQEAKEEAARKAKEQKIATLKKKLVGTWRNSVNDGTTSITETVKVKADGTFTATFKVKYNEEISPKTKYVYDVSMVIDKGDIVIDESEESILFYTNFMEAHVAGTRKKVGGLSEDLDIIALTRITGTLSKFLDYRFYANPSVSLLKSQSNTLNKAAAAAK